MGKVMTAIKLENWGDIELLAAGKRREPPRSVETEALVDTAATKLYLKRSVIRQLGLRKIGQGTSHTMSNRREPRRIFSVVRLEIQGRTGQFSVIELSDDLPNIIGQIPLEDLDWVVDPKRRRLIPNPEHKNGVRFDDY